MQKAKRETLFHKRNQGRGAEEKEGECVNVFVGFQREHFVGLTEHSVIHFYADKTRSSSGKLQSSLYFATCWSAVAASERPDHNPETFLPSLRATQLQYTSCNMAETPFSISDLCVFWM